MEPNEKEIILSTIHTLIELTFNLMKKQDGLNEADIEILSQNEETLKNLIGSIRS